MAEAGDSGGALFVVVTALADLRAGPDHRTELLSQVPHGHAVTALSSDESGRWRHAVAPDGLVGWVRDWSLAPAPPNLLSPAVRVSRSSLALHARSLPMGSRLRLSAGPLTGPRWPVVLADGARAAVSRRDVVVEPPQRSRALTIGGRLGSPDAPFTADEFAAALSEVAAARVLATVESLLGVPYLWGGCSPGGLDCSGLLRLVFSVHGIALPRDAKDHAGLTERWRLPPDARRVAGDLLFFGEEGRVTHVAIAEGPTRFLHASGEVRRSSSVRPEERDRIMLETLLFTSRPPWRPPAHEARALPRAPRRND